MAKEKLYTIPLNDAVNANDECPFCYIERNIEQDLMDFVLGSGSSYMEADIRDMTDRAGFCRAHFKKMFDYGNTLGNAWILKTHYKRTIDEMKKQFASYGPAKITLKDRLKGTPGKSNSVSAWIAEREGKCYICNHFEAEYERYLDTFMTMYDRDTDFRNRITSSKGFCLTHFGDLCEYAELHMKDSDKKDFFAAMFRLMEENMDRLQEDVSWMVEKFDYRNKDADWKTSKDAIQRGMQKLKGGYPADPVYKQAK